MKTNNILVIGVLLGIFGFLIFAFYPSLGDFIGIFGIVPILVASWKFGRLGGVVTALIVGLIAISFAFLTNIIPERDHMALIARSLAGIAIGYIVGMALEESIKIKKLESETLALKLGVERSHDIVFITNKEGEFTYINPAFTKVYGYLFEDVKGKTPRILKSGFRDEKFYKDFWKKINSGQSMQVDMRNMTKDGRMLEIESSVNPVIGTSGEINGFLSIQRDVTERKNVELDLVKRTKELEKLNGIMVDREIRMGELKKQLRMKSAE